MVDLKDIAIFKGECRILGILSYWGTITNKPKTHSIFDAGALSITKNPSTHHVEFLKTHASEFFRIPYYRRFSIMSFRENNLYTYTVDVQNGRALVKDSPRLKR